MTNRKSAQDGRNRPWRLGRAGLVLLLIVNLGSLARADEDQERASRAVAAGQAVPLQQILDRARQEFGGDVVDVDFEDEQGRARYELKLLAPDGRLLKLYYDAATGKLLSSKEKPPLERRRE